MLLSNECLRLFSICWHKTKPGEHASNEPSLSVSLLTLIARLFSACFPRLSRCVKTLCLPDSSKLHSSSLSRHTHTCQTHTLRRIFVHAGAYVQKCEGSFGLHQINRHEQPIDAVQFLAESNNEMKSACCGGFSQGAGIKERRHKTV